MTNDNVPRIGVVFRPQLPPERLRDYVTRVESAGLDDLWLWEDCFLEGGLTTATAALAWTDSLRVGLGLMPVPLRNPALAAMEVATVARMFPGRFVPAAGHGILDWMAQVGARVASPLTLLREWTTATRALLHGETVTVSGQYVTLDRVALDWPPPVVPPLLLGASGPRTLALAGEISDGMVLDAGKRPEELRAAIERAGVRPDQEVVAYVASGVGPEAPGRIAAELAAWGRPTDTATATGTPEQVAELVLSLAKLGVGTVVLQPTGDDPDPGALVDLAAAVRKVIRT